MAVTTQHNALFNFLQYIEQTRRTGHFGDAHLLSPRMYMMKIKNIGGAIFTAQSTACTLFIFAEELKNFCPCFIFLLGH